MDALLREAHGLTLPPIDFQSAALIAQSSVPVTSQADVDAFWEEAFRYAALTPSDTAPQRALAVWRFVREALRLTSKSAYAPLHAMERTDRRISGTNDPPRRSRYVSRFLERGVYFSPPQNPQDTLEFFEFFHRVCGYLGVPHGSIEDRDLGHLGLRDLEDPETLHHYWPDLATVAMLEDYVVHDALEKLVRRGHMAARLYLSRRWGLQSYEIDNVVALSRDMGRSFSSSTAEEDKALMSLQLEDFINRARDAGDLRNEVAGIKQQAIVKGISRAQTEDFFSVFHNVVDTTARVLPPNHDTKSIPLDPARELPNNSDE